MKITYPRTMWLLGAMLMVGGLLAWRLQTPVDASAPASPAKVAVKSFDAAPATASDRLPRPGEDPGGAAVSSQDSEELLSQWLGASGYGLLESFIPTDAAKSWPVLNLQTDYQTYDLATLRALADQDDPVAAFYYAMNPQVAHAEAVTYFESALVNGAYPVAAFEAALRFDSMAIERDSSEPFYERLQANPGMQMQEDERSYLLWLATAAQLNDPLSLRLLETQILPRLDAGRRDALRAQAAENLQRLNDLRASRKLPPLAPISLPPQAQRYIQEQYFDRSEAMIQQMQAEAADDAP